MLKILLLKIFYPKVDGSVIKQGLKQICQFIFFQKILRINSSVPWLVHWSSIVTEWEKITKPDDWLNPGASIGCYIQGKNGIKIGKNVFIGPGVKIISSNHNPLNLVEHLQERPILIGDDCWLAANSIILPGVILQPKTIVAAGAVVVKSHGVGNCVVAGNPSKIVKMLE